MKPAAVPSGTQSIQDYRNIVKLLKLKIIKLQKKNEELQKQLSQPFPQSFITNQELHDKGGKVQNLQESHSPRPFQSNSNYNVIKDLAKGAHRLGLTPEMLFRAADQQCSGKILVDDFRVFLTNLKIGLNHSQISRIVFMCDEECAGIIYQDDFYNLLAAYEVNEQKKIGGTRTFSQLSLIKLAGLISSKNLSPESAFDKITNKKIDFISMTSLADWVKANSGEQMNQKEVVAAFNHLDMDRNGKIAQEFWVAQIKRASKAGGQPIINIGQQAGEGADNKPGQPSQKPSGPDTPAFNNNKNTNILNQIVEGGDTWNYVKRTDEQKASEAKEILKKLESKKFKLIDILRDLTKKENVKSMKAGILIQDMFNLFQKYKKEKKIQFPKPDILNLFQTINERENGSINYTELIKFYGQNKTDKGFEFLFELVAAKLRVRELEPKIALQLEGYPEEYQIIRSDMDELSHDLFDINRDNQKVRDDLWLYFSQGKEKFKTILIIEDLNRYYKEEDNLKTNRSLNKSALNQSKSMNMASSMSPEKMAQLMQSQQGEITYDFQYFENFLQKYKPELTVKDFASQELYYEGPKPTQKPRWATIVTSQLAAIQLGHQLIRQMKEDQSSNNRWRDPEFGANQNDQFGSKSMYFSDNDIAPGCPEPSQVLWQSPQEILKLKLENQEPIIQILYSDLIKEKKKSKYADKEQEERHYDEIIAELPTHEELVQKIDAGDIGPELAIQFIKGGAGSSDVKQSKYLGNCWFISALSLIASDDFLLQGYFNPEIQNKQELNNQDLLNLTTGVHPPIFRYLRQFGIFVFQFFQQNKWHYVFVDETICCRENGEIIYANCFNPTQTWVPLIQKALAKLHHCYQALISGDIAQGLADMTGMVADKTKLETAKLNEYSEEADQDREKLWQKLLQAQNDETMMGCSAEGATQGFIELEGQDTGVMSGHAYSILDVIEIPWHPDTVKDKLGQQKEHKRTHETHRLLKIRNPWGFGEQKLQWSQVEDNDTYEQLLGRYAHGEGNAFQKYFDQETEKIKKANIQAESQGICPRDLPEQYDAHKQDGTFLMNFKFWRTLFSNLFMCINFPNDFEGFTIASSFTKQNCAGVPKKDEQSQIDYALKNPQYILQVKAPTQIYITLKQNDGRLFYGEQFPYDRVMSYLLLCVFQLDEGEPYLKKFDVKQKQYDSGKLNLRRECDTDTNPYQPGKYAIIPCTKVPGEQGDIFISLYAQVPQGQNINNILTVTDRNGDKVNTIPIVTESDIAPPGRKENELMLLAENFFCAKN